MNTFRPLTIAFICSILATSFCFAEGEQQAERHMQMYFNHSNTHGWSMMTRQERKEHQAKMHSFKTIAECNAYMDEHHKIMQQRAKEKGKQLSMPKHNACDMMQKRGMFHQASK